ncbi:MAG: hypothetical protein Q9166_000385 [cf. Caloplaca sp. 2 TL-2023]
MSVVNVANPRQLWALAYTLSSMLLGVVLTRLLTLPSWVTPALTFNNTTSLPLLLIQSLGSAGVLKPLLISDTDTPSAALNRAKSYFLVCAIVSNSLTFSLGPRLLDHEEAPDPDQLEGKNQPQIEGSPDRTRQESQNDQSNGHANGEATENTSLLPEYVVRRGVDAGEDGYRKGKHIWDRLGPKTRSFLDLLYAFLNAPLVGAVVGAIIGLSPPLHRAFFDEPQEGGVFKAWLISCIQNVGNIFAALQVGLSHKNGHEIYSPALVGRSVRTDVLPNDPILIFAMMLMPAGPPAMAISSLAECNDSNAEEKMAISKFLIVAYIISPVLCFTVVGSLKASEAVLANR